MSATFMIFVLMNAFKSLWFIDVKHVKNCFAEQTSFLIDLRIYSDENLLLKGWAAHYNSFLLTDTKQVIKSQAITMSVSYFSSLSRKFLNEGFLKICLWNKIYQLFHFLKYVSNSKLIVIFIDNPYFTFIYLFVITLFF